jgi:tRNA(Ile)-lysidine synthase
VDEALDGALADCGGCHLLVGFSGGLDSTVLLAALAKKREPSDITALHIHHGLIPAADDWLRHCENVSTRLGVRFESERVQVEMTGNLEDAARRARYGCWEARLRRDDVLLLGHHLDDQVETLLLRLVRGGGAALLSGMPRSRPVGQGRLLRPFLAQPRADLEAYARENALSWIEDVSNADIGFDRNFVRHEVLPILRQRWPDVVARVGASAVRLREDAALADVALDEMVRALEDGRGGLVIDGLIDHPFAERVLRQWLRRQGAHDVADRQLQQILEQAAAGAGAAPRIDVAPGVRVHRHGNALLLVDVSADHPTPAELTWSLDETASFGAGTLGACLVDKPGLDGAIATVLVRPRAGGERLRIRGREGSRSVKRLLAEADVPVWLRGNYPLVYVDGELAAVPGIAVADWIERDGPAWRLEWET